MKGSGHDSSRSALGRWTAALPMVVGVLVMILGLTVIVGWHADLPLFIQLHPTFAPMKYNTALCFLCSGAALLAIGMEVRRVAVGGSLTVHSAGAGAGATFTLELPLRSNNSGGEPEKS
jgi:hypothetical protein